MAKQLEGVSERILNCAKAEFLDKGYTDASLRAIAAAADTINYELVCILGKRVPRVFIRDGKVLTVTDYICNR